MVRFDNSRRPGYSRATAYCAILLMLGGLLSACSVWDSGTAALPGSSDTSDSPDPATVDPWTLPIEERPELFNPCTEISLKDLAAAGLENPTPWPEAEDSDDDPPLKQCGWKSEGASLVISAFWTTLDQLSEGELERITSRTQIESYSLGTLEAETNNRDMSCAVVSETSRGSVSLDVVRLNSESIAHRQENDSCDDLVNLFRELTPKFPGPRS